MAKNKQQERKDQQEEMLGGLQGLGLGGQFTHLVDQAIREMWGISEFLSALMHSPQFRRMFPGLVQGGTVADFLSPGHSLGEAIANYRRLQDSYELATKGYGVPITGGRMAMLIRGQVSPEEFATRFQAINVARANPGLMEAYNEELKLVGMKPLDEIGWFKYLARSAAPQFYDVYEAAQLRQSGLEISPEEALGAAHAIGAPGQLSNISELVRQARLLKPDIGPELANANISDADLVMLESGVDPRGLEPQLRQMLAQRRAFQQAPPGS